MFKSDRRDQGICSRHLERDRKANQNVPSTAEIQLVTSEEEACLSGAPGITIVMANAKTFVLPLTSGGTWPRRCD